MEEAATEVPEVSVALEATVDPGASVVPGDTEEPEVSAVESTAVALEVPAAVVALEVPAVAGSGDQGAQFVRLSVV